MKLLLAVLALISAGPVAADCPKAADWARAFYSEHYSFYADPSDRVLQFTTPEFGTLLKREWAYSNGEIGHLDYDPRLGGQDGEIGKPVRFFVETESPDTAIVSMSYLFVLDSKHRPNGTRCTWYCASENTSAGSFKISSLRAATRCHMCTHFRSPNQHPAVAYLCLVGRQPNQ
jgi:hypothetical protein